CRRSLSSSLTRRAALHTRPLPITRTAAQETIALARIRRIALTQRPVTPYYDFCPTRFFFHPRIILYPLLFYPVPGPRSTGVSDTGPGIHRTRQYNTRAGRQLFSVSSLHLRPLFLCPQSHVCLLYDPN